LDLAAWKGESLSARHLETAVAANEAFEADHKGVGRMENMRAYA